MIKFPPIINHAYIMLTEQCNLRCEYCVSGDTLITMSDMSRKPIKEINVGDEILSINENVKNNNKFLTFEKTYVSKIFKPRYVEKLYHIIMNDSNNLYITGEHPLLTSRKKWITVEKLKIKKKNEQKIYTTLFPNNKCNENNFTKEYMIGYFIACWLGDGSIKKYEKSEHYKSTTYVVRFVVKDDNIMNFMKQCFDEYKIDVYEYPFCISKKYNIIKNAFISRKKDTYDKLMYLINSNLNKNTNEDYLRGFLAGIYDCEGSYGKDGQLKISNGNTEIIQQIKTALDYFGYEYTFKESKTNVNMQIYNFRLLKKSIISFLENIQPKCLYKITNYDKRFRKYMINSIESITEIDYNDYVYNIETGNHTYIANNIIVHNCYIKNRDAKNEFSYDWIETLKNSFTCLNKPRLIFFGGEPLLKIDLIKRIVDNYKNDFQFQVVTNGTVNLHKFINEIYKPNKSIFDIQISWDGNNNTRKTASKKSTNDIVYNNIINELENGGAFEARCVINDESVNYMFNTYKTFKEFYFKYPFSGDFTIAHQLSFNDDFSIKLGKELEKIYNDIILQLDTDNFFMPRFLLKIITNILQNTSVISCDIGTHVVIKPNGDIYPCTILSQQDERFKLGNIKTYVDTEIITKLRTPASCQKNCQFKNVCDGGCRYERIKLFPNDWECKVCNHTCKIYEIIYLKSKEFLDKIDENKKDKLLKYINEYNLWSIDYVDCLTDNSKRIF